MRIAVVAHLDERAEQLIRDTIPAPCEVVWGRKGVWDEAFASCDAVFGTIPAAWLPRLRALRWLQLESVGFEYYRGAPAADLAERGITVTNLKGQFAAPAAETALAGLLALLRGVDKLTAARETRQWRPLEIRPLTSTLAGRSALVLGDGSIGRRLRVLLEAFQCRVLSYARTSARAELHGPDELDRALPATDVLVSALPSTAATRGLLDGARLGLLPASAVVVNVGRGDVLDEAALVQALESGALGGAVLDVTAVEPLPDDSPLWTAPRTVLTQHTAGGYADESADKAKTFLENVGNRSAGRPLRNVVDLAAGY